jgi:hypothetical protein
MKSELDEQLAKFGMQLWKVKTWDFWGLVAGEGGGRWRLFYVRNKFSHVNIGHTLIDK